MEKWKNTDLENFTSKPCNKKIPILQTLVVLHWEENQLN